MNIHLNRRAGSLAARAFVLSLCIAALPALAQQAVSAAEEPAISMAELTRRLEQLSAELANVKSELAQVKSQQAATRDAAPTAAGGWNGGGASTQASGGAGAIEQPLPAAQEPATVLSSYGEINYNRPSKATEKSQADVRRLVIGLQHRVNDRTKVVGELEVEHAVTSGEGDPGEVAVEQAYVEHQLTSSLAARGGLFLMPAGLLNENHEPTAFYGVERNFVETAIIPTTWREAGVQLVANLDNGLTLQGGITTGFDLTKWDAASSEGAESPLGAIHQEAAQARARNLTVFGAANWRGIPGLLVGGSVFTGDATHGQAGYPRSRVTLADVHARWTPGRWDLSALYARGSISNTARLNQTLVGNPTLIPKSFDGWYAQAAYKLWSQGDYQLSPFVRYENFNTARSYAYIGQGLTPASADTERVITVGANFWLSPSVVVKADIQRFKVYSQSNRVNLGLGWSF